VNDSEFLGLIGWEVRSEHAVLSASPPEQFARRAWRQRSLFSSTLFHGSLSLSLSDPFRKLSQLNNIYDSNQTMVLI